MKYLKLEPDPEVLEMVNPKALDYLANYDDDYWIRLAVASNPNTSLETLNRLFNTKCSDMMTTDPETLDTVSFLRWLDCADVDSLESFANRHIVT
jgi:hypothetical protein